MSDKPLLERSSINGFDFDDVLKCLTNFKDDIKRELEESKIWYNRTQLTQAKRSIINFNLVLDKIKEHFGEVDKK